MLLRLACRVCSVATETNCCAKCLMTSAREQKKLKSMKIKSTAQWFLQPKLPVNNERLNRCSLALCSVDSTSCADGERELIWKNYSQVSHHKDKSLSRVVLQMKKLLNETHKLLHHVAKYCLTNCFALHWPTCCQLTFIEIKDLSHCWLKLIFGGKNPYKLFLDFESQFHQLFKVFIIFSFRIVNLHPPHPHHPTTSDLSKLDPLQDLQQITGACCLLLSFFDQQIFRRGFFKEITSHFTSQAEQKLPSNKRLLLTACGRSWQHCWTLGSSTGLQKHLAQQQQQCRTWPGITLTCLPISVVGVRRRRSSATAVCFVILWEKLHWNKSRAMKRKCNENTMQV